jgi:hypothetical protein
LPHNPDGTIYYDGTGGTIPNVSHSGTALDPVTGTVYPIVNSTVTFRPAVVEGDAAPGTTTEYSSIGVPANAADDGGLPYIPTLFTATSQSWSFPYTITLYPQHISGTQVLPDTTDYFQTALDTSGATGDIIEYEVTSKGQTPVYDVTAGTVIAGPNYVPMTVNPDSGTINFAQPALPDPTTPTNRFWQVHVDDINGTVQPGPAWVPTPGTVDLTKLPDANGNPDSPLSPNDAATGSQVTNAHIVPGSLRVYGPDSTPGPNLGVSVLYTLVSQGTPLTFNEYRVDYLSNELQFYVVAANKLQAPANDVQISFDYQANLTPVDPTNPVISAANPANPANPMLVKVDYQTRDLVDVNIGVRIFDNSQGHSLVIPVSNRVQIGNSNR